MTKAFLKTRPRMLFLSGVVILIWATLMVRFFHIQVIRANDLADRSKRQGGNKVKLAAVRGTVKDRHGDELATNVVHYSFAIHPSKVENRDNLINAFTKVARPLLELNDKGLVSSRHGYRSYPHKNVASQIIGFTNVDNKGIEGVEKQFDKKLQGKDGWIVLQRDGRGGSRRNNAYPRMAPVDGSDVFLTIDLQYQAILQDELQRQVNRTSAGGAMGVILEPATGKILAMASLPDYDPNEAATFPRETFRNRAVTDQFEPGSTFKLVAATAALSHRTVSLQEEFNCGNGTYDFRGLTIEDWEKFGLLTFPQIIQNSSNVGTVKIAERIGSRNLYATGRKYGFGTLSGITFPGEAKGVFKPTDDWSGISIAEISIGYEVSITTLQLALAYGAVANGGFLMKPHIVDRIVHPSGTVSYEAEPTVVRRVASREVMDELTDMLELAVSKGTGTKANLPGWDVAGKTGTAKKFMSVDDPRDGLHWGGETSAPVFKSVMTRVIQADNSILVHKPVKERPEMLAVKTSRSDGAEDFNKTVAPILSVAVPVSAEEGMVIVPDVRGRSLRNARSMLRRAGLKVSPTGSGTVVWQSPAPGKIVKKSSFCSIGLGLN